MIRFSKYFCLAIAATTLLLSCEKENILSAREHTLPLVEIEIDQKYLWSADSGLYVIGTNGIHIDCSENIYANYNQKWEYPALVRYFPPGADDPSFVHPVGFRIKGNCSRRKGMKSIGLYWRREYGISRLDYRVFGNAGISVFKRLVLRNSGNDFGLTHMKDAAIIEIIKDYADVEYAEYQPVILYLNNEYWGIHNLREMITPHHFRYHYGIDDDRVDLLGGSPLFPEIDDGASEEFTEEVVNFVRNTDLSIEENYLTLGERIDIDNLIDYLIIETYTGNRDWPVTNDKWWRDDLELGSHYRWRWIPIDHDACFEAASSKDVWIGDLYGERRGEKKNEGFFIFNQLIKNDHFKSRFLDRYIFFIEEVFEPNRVDDIIAAMKSNLEPEYALHQEKWQTLSKGKWESAVDEISEINRERNKLLSEIINELHEDH